MEPLELITTAAGTVMSFAWFLQAYKIVKRKSSADVSLSFLLVFFFGAIVWIAYGLQINSFPVIFANAIAIVGILTVLVAFFKYQESQRNRWKK